MRQPGNGEWGLGIGELPGAGWWVVGVVALGGCGASAEPLRKEAEAPGTVAVESVTVAAPLLLPAQLYVERDATVYARSPGTINWLGADLGAAVRGGQILARLESVDQEIALARAQEARDAAARQAERLRGLTKGGFATRADSESVESALHQAEISLRQARRDLELTRVIAPFGGIVSARYARVGRLAARGDSLFRVTALSPMLAAVQVPESEAGGLKVGSEAQVSGASGSGSARVIRMAPVVDAASGTRQYVVQVVSGRGLVPGGSVTVQLGSGRRRVLAVPRAAVSEDGVALVWEDGRGIARAVTVGADVGDDKVEVVSGLAAGERVVPGRR